MSGWTAPRTWATGDQPTSAQMNTELRDNLLALGHPIGFSHVDADVVNTASEWSLFNANPSGGITVPANALGANGVLHALFLGDFLVNVAGTITLRVRFGGSTVVTALSARDFGDSATRRVWRFDIFVVNRNSASSQVVQAYPAFDQEPGGGGPTFANPTSGTSSIDTTADQVFDFTAQWSGASTSLSWRKLAHRIYLEQAA